MIKKFVTIKNVGKFRSYDAADDVALSRLTLLYAENTRGKTTLCDILRSLRSGNAAYVIGRRTLGYDDDDPEILIRLEGENAKFENGAWTSTVPELAIFDSTFVHENVYAGEFVDHEHKKNLYRVIVGEEGAKLARRVAELDGQVREAGREVTAKKSVLQGHCPDGITLEDFVGLKLQEDVDTKIQRKAVEAEALRRASEIASKSLLLPVSLPLLPGNFASTLNKELDDVADNAEELVRQHLREHTDSATEPWLAQGVGYIKGDLCPFCEQSMVGNNLVAAYRAHFGDSYRELKSSVTQLLSDVRKLGSDATLFGIRQIIDGNASLFEFWSQFAALREPALDGETVATALRSYQRVSEQLVERKAAAILEPVLLDSEFDGSSQAYESAKEAVEAYNTAVATANAAISAKKGETGAGDLAKLEVELAKLKASKKRHQQEVTTACQEYALAAAAKQALEAKKNTTKTDLEAHTEAILGKFQTRINRLLDMFSAGFRITGARRQYAGGRPSSTYQLVINDVPVDLGDSATSIGDPSFRNTLSSGDRGTLALVFFLAKLELDPDLSKKVVVFDDPFTSQDRSRRTCTQQRICKLATAAKQVIVLSHEPGFLKLIWDAVGSGGAKCLQLCRIGQDDTAITPWDICDETRSEYYKNHGQLTAFVNDGDGEALDVVRTIRPVLEGYYRFAFPGVFAENEWLGNFISRIRDAEPGESLHAAHRILDDLQEINDYSKKYHHSGDQGGANTEPINDGELRGFVQRTLDLVGGF